MPRTPLALQLYSVRGEHARDLPATLMAVREIGYEAVEPWGYDGAAAQWQGLSGAELRRMMDDHGLACCGMHIATDALLGDNFARTVELSAELGNRFIIVAADKPRMSSEAGIAELAWILADAAAKLAPDGMFTGYHAHPFDFVRFGGKTAWDILFAATPPEVVMQLDIGNCAVGGGDPVAILRKFPGRARTVHLKEYGGPDGAIIGEGEADWPEIFRLCDTEQHTEWFVVEEGGADGTGFEICRRSYESLRRMGR